MPTDFLGKFYSLGFKFTAICFLVFCHVIFSYSRIGNNYVKILENRVSTIMIQHQAAQDKVKEKAILMLQKGKISIDEIRTFFPELSDEEIEEVKGEVVQLV